MAAGGARATHHLSLATSQAWRDAIINDEPVKLKALIYQHCHSTSIKLFFHDLADLTYVYKAFDDVPPLIFAVQKQSRKCMETMLEAGCPVDTNGHGGVSALHVAVQGGNLNSVSFLLDAGANINATTDSGKTVLHFAADNEDAEMVCMLARRGATVNAADIQGNLAIHHAAEKGSEKCVEMLLDCRANIDSSDKDGDTPLHYSASRGNMGLMILLLNRGSNIHSVNRVGRTPLHMAAYYGRIEVLRYLLEHGARVNAKDIRGQTPLHRAAVDGSTSCIRLLLDNGATVMDQDLVDGCTPLHLAAGNNAAPCVQLLIDSGSAVNRPVDVDGNTPLHSAIVPYGPSAGFDSEDTMLFLLEAEANVDAMNLHGETPLWWAILGEHNQALRILLQVNCNLDHLLSGNTIRQKWRLSWPAQQDHMCHGLNYTIWRKDWSATLCLLVAGCDPAVLVRDARGKKSFTDGLKLLDQADHWVEYVQTLCHEPRTLQAWGRKAIRDALGKGHCLERTLSQLPLPDNLLSYLSLEEVRDIDFT